MEPLVLFVLALVFATSQGADICGLPNYDISSVQRRPYWFFNISSSDCAADANKATCKVYFTLCQSLPTDLKCGDNSGMCQQVSSGSEDRQFSLGIANDRVFNNNDTTGFFTYYPNGTNETEMCEGLPTTVLMFYSCDSSAVWDSRSGDVTNHLEIYRLNDRDNCQILVIMKYSGACVPVRPIIPGCNSLDHYNLSAIQSQETWLAQLPLDSCKNPKTSSSRSSHLQARDDPTCDLLFSFCEPLPNGICYNSVFCQLAVLREPLSFGSFNKDLKITGDADYTGFTIEAFDGTKTTDCPNGTYSTLIFNCSKDADWTSSSKGDITKYTTAEPKADECQFSVIFQYDGACTSYRPKKKGSSAKPSPVGGILIGIFFGVLILYFLVGAIIQFARGKRGAEIIPNYELWNSFFVLVLEGCQFSLDIVTCFQLRKNSKVQRNYETL